MSTGATILPGFINAHVHAGYNVANLAAWAQGGVTTVRDLSTTPAGDLFARRDALRDDDTNARLVSAGTMVTVPDGYPMSPLVPGRAGRDLKRGCGRPDQAAAGQRGGPHQDRHGIGCLLR